MKHVLLAALLVALPATGIASSQPPAQGAIKAAPANPADIPGIGVIKAIDESDDAITVHHEPIAALGWPEMTMLLKVASPDLLVGIKVGDKIQFTLRPDETNTIITSIKRLKP